MLGLLDDRFSAAQSVLQDEIREVSIFERRRPQEHRLFLSPNPHGHSLIIFYCYSWHGESPSFHFVRIQIVHVLALKDQYLRRLITYRKNRASRYIAPT